MTLRSKIAMLLAEFLGTAALATVAINITRSQIGIGYFVAIGISLALGALVLLFSTASGAHFNPALTLGLWTLRKIPTLQAVAYIAAQLLGGVVAWKLGQYLAGSDLRNIAGESFKWRFLIAEAVGTMVFSMGIAAASYRRMTSGAHAAIAGGSLLVGTFIASLASNAVLNPAIALGNQSWGRAYIFGPIIGAVLGMNLYALFFAPARALVDTAEPARRSSEAIPVPTDVEAEEEIEAEAAPRREAVTRGSTVTAVRTSSAAKSAARASSKPAAKPARSGASKSRSTRKRK